jgi:hypothetical protein
LLGDAALSTGFVCLGSPEDHEATISLQKLGVILWGGVHRLASLGGRLLGLALLAEGATDVAPDGGAVFEEVLLLSPWSKKGASSTFSKCMGRASCPQG